MLFNIFLHFRRSTASSCHSSTCSSLKQRPHSPYLLALHCYFCNHWGCVKLKPTVVALPVVVYSTAAAPTGRTALEHCRRTALEQLLLGAPPPAG
jgi:hypothetical protein